MSQECQQSPESGKGKEITPLEPPDRNTALLTF